MNSPLRKDELLRREDDPSREPERIQGEHERIHRELNSEGPRPVEVSEESDNDLDRPPISDRPGPQPDDSPEPRRNPVSIDARRTQQQEELRENPDRDRASTGDRGSMGDLQSRWSELQTIFVDDPRSAVQRADEVVSQTIQRVHERMNTQRSQLSERWQRNDNISTEDLRVAFQNYRNFFRSLVENPVK